MNSCGTTAGYKRHERRGETVCPACREANTRDRRERRRREAAARTTTRKATPAEQFDWPAAITRLRALLDGNGYHNQEED